MFRVCAILLTFFVCLGCGNKNDEGVLIQGMVDMENIMVKELELHMDKMQKQQANIQRFLAYVDVLHEDVEDTEEYFSNPLNAFTTLSRFVNNWKREVFDLVLDNDTVKEYHSQVDHQLTKREIQMPMSDDLLDMTFNLLEFQDSSGLSTSDLANEVLFEDKKSKENVTLSASECYVIGRGYHKLKFYEHAAEWLFEARSRLIHEAPSFATIEKSQILEELVPTLQQLGNYKLANKLNSEILKANSKHESALKYSVELNKALVLSRLSNQIHNEEL